MMDPDSQYFREKVAERLRRHEEELRAATPSSLGPPAGAYSPAAPLHASTHDAGAAHHPSPARPSDVHFRHAAAYTTASPVSTPYHHDTSATVSAQAGATQSSSSAHQLRMQELLRTAPSDVPMTHGLADHTGTPSSRAAAEDAKAMSPDFAGRNEMWLQHIRERNEERRIDKEREELAELRNKPEINPRSARLAGQHSQRRGQDISESLYADAARLREERRILQERAREAEMLGYPAITRQAAELVRDEDITDRLYGDAKNREIRRRQALEAKEHSEKSGHGREGRRYSRAGSVEKSSRGRRSSLPGSTRTGARSRRSSSVDAGPVTSSVIRGRFMHDYALELQEKRKAQKEQQEKEAAIAAKPAINKKSREIAATLRTRAKDRLWSAVRQAPKDARLRALSPAHKLTPAFGSSSPRMGSRDDSSVGSRRRVRRRGTGRRARSSSPMSRTSVEGGDGSAAHRVRTSTNPTLERLYREGTVRVAARRVAKSKKEDEELQQCTFKPEAFTRRPPSDAEGESIYQRSRMWAANREIKLLKKRVAAVGDELQPCTFQPALNGPSRPTAGSVVGPMSPMSTGSRAWPSSAASVASAKSVEEIHPSVSDFIERQKRARAIAESKRNTPHVTGANWTGKVTKPREFRLGHRKQAAPVQALRKPVALDGSRPASVPTPPSSPQAPVPPTASTAHIMPASNGYHPAAERFVPSGHPSGMSAHSPSPMAAAPHSHSRAPPPAHLRDMYSHEVTRALQATGDLPDSASSPFNRHAPASPIAPSSARAAILSVHHGW